MGRKIIQTIRTCAHCNTEPDDGTAMWEMCGEYICEDCFDEWDEQQQIALEERNKHED